MILVLDPEARAELVEDVVRRVERLGFRAEISRGQEQIVVTLAGEGDPYVVEAEFAQHDSVDVIPILSGSEYRRLALRRRVLTGIVTGLGALTALGAGVPVVGFLMPPKGSLGDPNFVKVATRAELEKHSAKVVSLLGRPHWIVRLENARYVALSAVCTHMSVCNLEWNEQRSLLLCPCHGGAFDVNGNVVMGPPSIPLATKRVEVVGEDIYLRRDA
jgi:cytochrome b6-f complex iron-sulfur subunit